MSFRKVMFCVGISLALLGCKDASESLTNAQLTYYMVDFNSFGLDYPDSSVRRDDLIQRFYELDESELDKILHSKFTYPYGILKPAFLEGTARSLEVALQILDYLEGKGLNIEKGDNAGCSSIHMAYLFQEQDMLQVLLQRYDIELFKGNPDALDKRCRLAAKQLLQGAGL